MAVTTEKPSDPLDDQDQDSSVAVITTGTSTYQVVVPHYETDYIQGLLMSDGTPYEAGMLAAMAEVVGEGDLVLDIGANIGNHTLFLAAAQGCRVEAFEPGRSIRAGATRCASSTR